MRVFDPDFTTEHSKVETARPFLTAVFNFAAGDLHLSERSLIVPYSFGTLDAIIQGFGRIGTALTRDFNIVDVGDTEIGFVNLPTLTTTAYAGRRFSDLWSSDLDAVDVDLYLNYLRDDDSIVREVVGSYVAKAPSSYDEELGSILLTSRLEKYAQRNVLKVARPEDYINVRESDANKPFALPFGVCRAIPTLRLGDVVTSGQQIHTVCESPPENPVATIDEVYWGNVKLTNQDIVIEADTGADLYPIELRGSPPNGSGSQHGYRQRNNLSLTSGGTTVTVGPFVNQSVWQPLVVPANLINPRIVAVLVKVSKNVSSADPPPLMMQVLDSLGDGGTIGDPDDNGALDNSGDAMGTANLESATLPTSAADGTGIFHFSGVVVQPSQRIYLLLSQTAGSTVDSYELSLEGSKAPGFNDYLNYAGSPVSGNSITMIVYYAIDGYKQLLPADMTAGEVSAAAAKLVTNFGVTEAVAAIGIEVKIARVYDRTGSVDLALVDVSGSKIANITIHGDELDDPTIPFTNWLDFRKYFDAPILIEPAEFLLEISGGLEAENGGIVFQGTNKLLTGGGVSPSPSLGLSLSGGFVYQPESAAAQPVGLVFKVLVMDWTEYVTGLAHSGFAELLFHPKTGGASAAALLPPIPDDVAISAKVTATKYQPDEVIHALFNREGIVDAGIDLAGSFAATAMKLAAQGYRYDGAVTTQQTYKALLARLAFEARLVVDWQWDKVQLKWLPSPADVTASVLTFDRSMIRHKGDDEHNPAMQLVMSLTPDSRIVNVIDAFYAFNPAAAGFAKHKHYASAASIEVYAGEKERPELFRFLYVSDDTTLASVCGYWLGRLAFKKRLFDMAGFLTELGVEKDDPIDVDSVAAGILGGFGEGGFGEGGYGGGTAFSGLAPGKFYVVQAVEYDWRKQPRALVVEAEEL